MVHTTRARHPKGLFFLAFTEAWERFSYYGMVALLVLYMVNQLLLPGHVEQIAGFTTFRAIIEGVFGPKSTQALASQIYGLYSGFVYFTPLLGGFVADRYIGQRNAVVIGALAMSAGHVAMAYDQSFLLAMLLLVTGSGLLKGNISAQVGALYPRDDATRRTRGFTLFSMAINFGAFFGPLLCGYLAQEYGWHRGFGAASVFMLCGLATYLYGYRYLPAKVEKLPTESASLSSADWRIVGALTAVIALTVFESIGYGQNANVFPVFAEAHVQLTVAGLRVPTPWYQSLDPFWAIAGVPMLFALWRYQTPRRGEPTDLVKMAIGAFVIGASNLILPLGLFVSGAERLHPLWAVAYFAIDSIGWLYYWPTLLAFVSRAAPSNVNATMMGITFMSLFVANNLVGWVGGYYEKMTPTAFWSMHAAVSALGGVLILLMAKPLSRVLSLERVAA